MERARRKLEHIKFALELGDGPCSTHLEDLRFLHNCLPETNPAEVVLAQMILGKQLCLPFFIDAITGGSDQLTQINGALARAAAEAGVGLAVGSQYGAVRTGQGWESYKIVRRENPKGLVLANISGLATVEEARQAVEMLEADGLELHLNVAQELYMPEGDREFAGIFERMLELKDAVGVPVIVKETGCGMAREQYARLSQAGFRIFNCGGAGGTNFPAIEAARGKEELGDMADWGVPTCWSLLEALALPKDAIVLASGGVRTALQAAKCLALGASAVGMAGYPLQLLMSAENLDAGAEQVVRYFKELEWNLRRIMTLVDCRELSQLRNVPLVITGETRDFLECRGYDLQSICKQR